VESKNIALQQVCLQLKSQIDKIEQAFEERLASKDKLIA
jgi:hypothetical protein